MIISDKQQQANRRNAQHSTGPTTPAGKEAVRLNALKYGLRARSTLLSTENAADFQQLCDDLETEWQPQTCTERLYLETMATSQWLLARVARSETLIYEIMANDRSDKHFAQLQFVAKQRAQLERSFRTAVADLKQMQKERQAEHNHQPPATDHQPPRPQAAPPPDYLMSDGTEAHPVFCSASPG